MARISFASVFFLLAALSNLAFTFSIKPRSVSQLKEDLLTLSGDVKGLASYVASIGSGLDAPDGLEAYLQIQVVENDLVKCNGDTSNIQSLSEDEAKAVIDIFQVVAVNIKTALTEFVEKQSYAELLIIPAVLVYGELKVLKESTVTLVNSLISLTPSNLVDLVEEGKSIRGQLVDEFDKAIAAYAG